jgi:sugar lactone lactonase YvrE
MTTIGWTGWRGRVLAGGWLAAVLWLCLPAGGEAAGPWRAQVVDAETGQPLEGVAVIAVWYRRPGGHPAFPIGPMGLVGSAEAITDAQGRFTLPVRIFFNPGLFTRIDEPELGLFLAGYGGWRFRDWRAPLTGRDVVIEMRPLPTPDERRKYLESTWTRAEHDRLRVGWQHATAPVDWIDLPYQQARRYEGAINQERAALGLRPIGIGYPHLGIKYLKPAPPQEGPEVARLRGASAVAIDAAGLRYVADTEHHRIVVFDAAGAMVRTWGRFGREPGEFQSPRGIALDRAGRVYVADWGNHRIQTFTREGQLLGQFGGLRFEDYDGGFTPTFVAAPDTGEVVVYAYGVFVFTPEGQRLGVRRIPLQVASRSGIAVDSAGSLYVVSDPDRRVHKLDASGRVVASFGRGYGEGEGQLFDPIGLAVDAAGRVWVADWLRGAGRVHGFAPDGRLLGTWSVGDDGQRLRLPQGVAVDAQGRIHVADRDLPGLGTITPGARE